MNESDSGYNKVEKENEEQIKKRRNRNNIGIKCLRKITANLFNDKKIFLRG